jgi:hypothetical protein
MYAVGFVVIAAGLATPGGESSSKELPVDNRVGDLRAAASGRSTPWTLDTILGATNSFSHVSIAVDSTTGFIHISYHDAVNQDLMMASNVGVPGNCGPSNTWNCVTLRDAGEVGKYNSIATYPLASDRVRFFVAFYDETLEALSFVRGSNGPAGLVNLGVDWIDEGIPGLTDRTGMYTSVSFDQLGVPNIAYQNETYDSVVGVHRMYAVYVGDGSGNCGVGPVAGDWQCTDVDFSASYGDSSSTSLALDGSNSPVIAYYDQAAGYPVVAYLIGSGGNCGTNLAWHCRTVSKASTNTGKHVSLFVENSGHPHIAYQNMTDMKLEYATYVGSGGNCGFSSITMQFEWQCDVIDDMDNPSSTRAVAIAADNFGYPIIAYQGGLDPGPAVIRVARPVAALGGSATGNCGPGDTWFCEGLHGNPYLVEADSVALAIDNQDGHHVVYSELDYYPYPAEYNLMFAHQAGDQVFGNGFEDGGTGSWSSTTP